ncbi:MAG TPA: hypothetical protein DEB24_00570, partial [Coriobacteriia bacterium]|nr:hypothetical protein [Coriobacteriia bacterium]
MAEFIIIAALVAGISALIIAIIALFLALRASGSQAKKKPSVRSSSANAYVEELKRQQSKGGVNETPETAKP